ncbi:unnamed protein product [Larinioides sclopetarius]|uniref:Uncharacterized protein n=1 Tax=Larinioides sclopetarius TaxID=280406 RepID=A0AAV2BDW1_9ARAC
MSFKSGLCHWKDVQSVALNNRIMSMKLFGSEILHDLPASSCRRGTSSCFHSIHDKSGHSFT